MTFSNFVVTIVVGTVLFGWLGCAERPNNNHPKPVISSIVPIPPTAMVARLFDAEAITPPELTKRRSVMVSLQKLDDKWHRVRVRRDRKTIVIEYAVLAKETDGNGERELTFELVCGHTWSLTRLGTVQLDSQAQFAIIIRRSTKLTTVEWNVPEIDRLIEPTTRGMLSLRDNRRSPSGLLSNH